MILKPDSLKHELEQMERLISSAVLVVLEGPTINNYGSYVIKLGLDLIYYIQSINTVLWRFLEHV